MRSFSGVVFAFWMLALVGLIGSGREAFAESRGQERVWVDVQRSNLRFGPGAQFESAGVVGAGQELDVLGTQEDWLKVSMPNGKTGWINRKAVTTTAPTPVVVKNLERKIAGVQAENEELSKEIQRLSDARQDLELEASKLKGEVAVLTARNEELKGWRTILWGLLGLLVLLTGWGLGYLTGVFRRQADDKRYDTLIKEAAGKKP